MDNLTHCLVGLALSRAGLNRIAPRATLILIVAANIPDVDIAATLLPLGYLRFHRHLTHALIVAPVMAMLPLLIAWLATRRRLAWKRCYLLSIIGIASHLALDYTNVYGIRLLLPFSARWLSLDITPVIDVWMMAVLLLSVAAPALSHLVSGEIGAPRQHAGGARRAFAIFALSFVLIYNCARAVFHERALATIEARLYMDSTPKRVAAFPDALNPLRWRGVAEGEAFYQILDVNLSQPFDPVAGAVYYKAIDSPAVRSANETGAFRALLGFAQYPIWTVTPAAESDGASQVKLMDLRFGNPRRPGFVATAIVDSGSHVLRSWFQFSTPSPK